MNTPSRLDSAARENTNTGTVEVDILYMHMYECLGRIMRMPNGLKKDHICHVSDLF